MTAPGFSRAQALHDAQGPAERECPVCANYGTVRVLKATIVREADSDYKTEERVFSGPHNELPEMPCPEGCERP